MQNYKNFAPLELELFYRISFMRRRLLIIRKLSPNFGMLKQINAVTGSINGFRKKIQGLLQ